MVHLSDRALDQRRLYLIATVQLYVAVQNLVEYAVYSCEKFP